MSDRADRAVEALGLGTGWQGFTGDELGVSWSELPTQWTEGAVTLEEHSEEDHAEAELIAEVHVRLTGLEEGESEVRFWVAPNKQLGAARTSSGEAQIAALETLRAVVDRELAAAYGQFVRDA